MKETIIGIMGAMPEETGGIVQLLDATQQYEYAGRMYYSGNIKGRKIVLVTSGWGKVAAAATVSTLIHKFNITQLIFTGVAGAIQPQLKIGDVVIANRLLQHDMDARPFIAQYEIPLLQKIYFESASPDVAAAVAAVTAVLKKESLNELIGEKELSKFSITGPLLYTGDIASGDRFFSADTQKQDLLQQLPGVLCVEMEGAAVAQVCYENGIPFTVIRTISDGAGDEAHIDFAEFIKQVAGKYAAAIIHHLFNPETNLK